MRINNNMVASNAARMIGINQGNATKNMTKLSSGLRINTAADDAGGLSISEKMRSQVRGLNQASKNTQDGISLIQTAEGGLNETHSILQRMRELAVQGTTDTLQENDRTALQSEFEALGKEIDDIADKTSFNKIPLLDGTIASGTGSLTIQTGAFSGDVTSMVIADMHTTAIGIGTVTLLGSNVAGVSAAITALDDAISYVSTERSKLGAMQNRFEFKIKNLDSTAENLQATESRIRDIDMAKEMVDYTKNDILNQAAQAMLGKANQAPQAVLQLLK